MKRDGIFCKKLFKKIGRNLNSIRYIFMFILISVTILVVSVSVVGSYIAYQANLLDVIGSTRSSLLSQLGDGIYRFKSNAHTASNLYYNDPIFLNYVQRLTAANYDEFRSYMDRITEQYNDAFNKADLAYSVVYLSGDGIGYSSLEVPVTYDYINPTIRIWFKDIYDAKGAIIDIASYKDKFLNKNFMLSARSVYGADGEIIGYLMIAIDELLLYDTYDDVLTPNSTIYVTDYKGNIITSSWRDIIGFHYFNIENLNQLFGFKSYAAVRMPKGKSLLSSFKNERFNIIVYEEIPLDYLLLPIRNTRNIVIGISAGVLILGIILAYFLSQRITEPIRSLRNKLLMVKNGGMNTAFDIKSYSEITVLNDGIGQMLDRINELIFDEKNKEKQRRKIQYLLLQAQINPHFVYNTLFSIKCLVDMEETESASAMLSAFIQLLRRTLKNPDTMSTVKEEMDSLAQYVSLQKLRYGENFEVIFEYEEHVAGYLIPTLLIQPLLENSISHGLDECKLSNIIVVSVNAQKGYLYISVEDNGIGMNKVKLEKILAEEVEKDSPHIGIKNIRDRINVLFGDNGKLEIESYPDEGTKITIKLPCVTDKKDDI